MDLNLHGRHALVCGASQGIGLATAQELAGLGADVTVLARREDVLRDIAGQLPRTGAQAHGWLAADATDIDRLRAKVEALVAGKPVHILVNNSGGPAPGTIRGTDPAAFEAAYRQHLLANHVLAEAVVPGMERDGCGRIVNVISTSVKEPIRGLGVSNTTRWAVASWAKTLATELAPRGITVNNVLPGSTETPRIEQIIATNAERGGRSQEEVFAAMVAEIPLGRFARPEETASAIAFLCSPAAAYITGVNLPVDGGRTRSL
ncbi:short-chain dehydrogenase [Lysobacter arseniciresistens ZS79]|uniref:Short-chain dehydrogenase n=1 Tax=Lysobacter arseniciresistens ZS79 TaxID=913325 RepID=A0A0A0F4M1_9GAMM|nr:SDR family oxidoreductase [Lysobacter arseniciresistens]KGM57303.1 short-chain dehydrogenase [Lysobacter arseniciresistens ZS79]